MKVTEKDSVNFGAARNISAQYVLTVGPWPDETDIDTICIVH